MLLRIAWAGMSIVSAVATGQPHAALTQEGLQQASGHCRVAERAIASGNFKKARRALARALEAWPEFPGAHVGLGHIALVEERYGDALREYTLARDHHERLASELLSLRAQSYADARHRIVVLSDELRNQSDRAPIPLRLSRLEEAIERLRRMPPPSGEKWFEAPAALDFFIGNAYYHLQRPRKAADAWRECIRKDRMFGPAYQNLAVAYWTMGMLGKARTTIADAEGLGLEVSAGLKADLAAVWLGRTGDEGTSR